MLLCNFCKKCYTCDYEPTDDDRCEFNGNGDDEAVIEYAQEHCISVTDAVMLISFCCGLRL